MAEAEGSYPRHSRSTVNRLKKRAHYDYETIHAIIKSSRVVHVSFPPADPAVDPFPALLPMIGAMGAYGSTNASIPGPMDCYLHGYISSRLMRMAEAATISSTPQADQDEDQEHNPMRSLPVSIAATKVDGIVLALTPFHHSYNYRSAILHGYATPVTDPDEKLWAMELITNSVVSQRWEHTRIPPDAGEMKSTQILKVEVVSASAKVRQGGPHDDRKDMKDEAMRTKVWTGVVPIEEQIGEPVEAEDNRSKMPEYLGDFVRDQNAEMSLESEKALKETENSK